MTNLYPGVLVAASLIVVPASVLVCLLLATFR